MKKKICFTIPGENAQSGIVKVVVNIANELSKNEQYEISLLPVISKKKGELNLDEKVNILPLNLGVHNNKFGKYFYLARALKEISKSYKPDIFIISGMEFVSIFTAVKSCFSDCKFYAWEHLNFSAGDKYRLEWFGKRMACKYWDGVITITKKDFYQYLQYTKTPNKLNQIYNLTDIKVKEIHYDLKSKKIVSCGYLAPIKGFDMLVDVAVKVFEKHSDWTWDIYGEGTEFDNLNKKINDLNLENNLFLKGYKQNINDLYSDYSFFVLTSRVEGMGMVLIEAQKSGLPVLSFDILCGPSDVITNEKNGYLIQPFNLDEMALKINSLIEDENKRKVFSKNSVMNLGEFEKGFIVNKWIELLEK